MDLEVNHLEVVFSKHKNGVEAVCSMFPGCRGIGEDEKEALVKLIQSVGRMMSKLTRSSLESVLLSDQYTEVLSGPYQSADVRKRLFALNPQGNVSMSENKPQMIFMIKSLHELPTMKKQQEGPFIQDAGFQYLDLDSDEDVDLGDGYLSRSMGGEELSFGFPLNLN